MTLQVLGRIDLLFYELLLYKKVITVEYMWLPFYLFGIIFIIRNLQKTRCKNTIPHVIMLELQKRDSCNVYLTQTKINLC